jgi:S-formylglutathione hydrolase FrmB
MSSPSVGIEPPVCRAAPSRVGGCPQAARRFEHGRSLNVGRGAAAAPAAPWHRAPVHSLDALVAALAASIGIAVLIAFVVVRRQRKTAMAATALTVMAFALGAAISSQLPAALASAALTGAPRSTATATAAPLTATWTPAVTRQGPGYPRIPRLTVPVVPAPLRSITVRNPVPLPTTGTIGSVVIPATVSHFVARPAIVYLPPAARVPQPRLLPVVIALSGQSRGAGPTDLVWKARLRTLMDAIAAKHDGVAPIVVVPDQLGPASANPMCVDSRRLGHAGTYLMRDVRSWIRTHLPVETNRRAWTVAGFSEGGTCAIQFASAHPDVFGSVVDVSGEDAPTNGSPQHTIAVGFGGSALSYEHATPAWNLAHTRYSGEQAYFSAGALDHHYGSVAHRMARRAGRAGMSTHLRIMSGLGHNWTVGGAGLAWGLGSLTSWWGI